jgi:hypothetical protein
METGELLSISMETTGQKDGKASTSPSNDDGMGENSRKDKEGENEDGDRETASEASDPIESTQLSIDLALALWDSTNGEPSSYANRSKADEATDSPVSATGPDGLPKVPGLQGLSTFDSTQRPGNTQLDVEFIF